MNIDSIIQAAKEHLLAQGDHMPMFYAETSTGMTLLTLTFMPDIGGPRMEMAFSLGRKLAQSEPGVPLLSVSMVSEAWAVQLAKGQPRKYARNEDDPNRVEVLIIASLTVEPFAQSVASYQMVRDDAGKLIDLTERGGEAQSIHNNLLRAFLAGYNSGLYSDEQLIQMALEKMRKDPSH